MYKIFADGQCIYNDVSPSPEMKVVDPVLTLEDNAAGSLALKLIPSNAGYSSVERLTSRITVLKDNVEIWEGRVISEKTDFWNNRNLTCEGELAYLNDTVQPPVDGGYLNATPRTFLESILAVHNAKVPAAKQFQLGSVTVTDKLKNEDPDIEDDDDEAYVFTNFESTLECIRTKLLEKLGGHLRVRKSGNARYLDYLLDYPDTASQTIEFRKNLLDFVKDYDQTDFATVIIPLGKAYDVTAYDGIDEYPTIEDVNSGRNYLKNDDAVAAFGWIEKTVHFDDAEEPEDLLEVAREYMDKLEFDKLKLEVTALDLHYLDADVEAITLLSEVRVISKPHGLDIMLPVTKLEIPLDKPADMLFTLGGETTESLSSYTSQLSRDAAAAFQETYKDAMSRSNSLLEGAKANAASLINNATKGYITITSLEEAGTEELYISDTKDYRTAQRFWRWNMGGLGYSKDGGRTYEVAMTMDGSISANFITTGTLSADRVRAGTLVSSDENQNVKFDLDKGELTIKSGSINLGKGNFQVTDGGKLTMKSGSINIANNFIVTDAGILTIKRGSIDLGSGNFKVTDAGELTIKKGSIDLGNGNFKVTDAGKLTMKSGSINLGDGNFKVTDAGVVTMNQGSITIGSTFSVSSNGYFRSTSGTIGGFSIGDSSIYSDLVSLNQDGINVRHRNSISGIVQDIGRIHTQHFVAPHENTVGLALSLNGFGNYISLESRSLSDELNIGDAAPYSIKLLYSESNSTGYGNDMLNLFCKSDFHNFLMSRAFIDPNTGGANGGLCTKFTIPTDKGDFVFTFKNGFLTEANAPYGQYQNFTL